MFDMFGKLNEMKQKMQEVKDRLENITVNGESGNGNIQVEANGNRTITNISIDPAFLKNTSSDELEDLLIIAVQRAMNNAKSVEETEMKSVAGGMLPGFGM